MSAALRVTWAETNALGALRVTDAVTGRAVTAPVIISAPGLTLLRKSVADHVIMASDDLGAGLDAPIEVRPLGGAYLARRFVLHLPRDSNPANAALPTSIFQPAAIPLMPAPAYPATGNNALLRVTVRRSTDGARIGGAVLRLRTGPLPAPDVHAMSDAAGEALIVVPNVPLTSPGPGATVVGDVPAQLDVLVDPALASFTADADIDAARSVAQARTTGFLDPDDIVTRLGPAAPAAVAVRIASGRVAFAAITWVPA
jgi:hypothetical protein